MNGTGKKWMILIVLIVGILGLSASALAQGAPTKEVEKNLLQTWVLDGGVIVFFEILLSVIVVALVIDNLLKIRRSVLLPEESRTHLEEMFAEKRYREAIDYSAEDPSYLGVVVNAALKEAANGYAAMERGLEEANEERTTKLFRRIEPMNVLGNVAPMIGLFGTVSGMISAFNKIVEAGGTPRPAELAGGISTALLTTFWGLLIAIPSLSLYAFFRHRIEGLSAESVMQVEEMLQPFKPGQRANVKQE